jgi:hypothetical protein
MKSMTKLALAAVTALGLAFTTGNVSAQSAVMVGTLGNFDALNNTGEPAYGFEIEMEGVQAADIYRIFGYWGGQNVIRYGAGTATNTATGVIVRWASPWDAATQSYTQATPVPVNRTTVPGESCWTLGMGAAYPSAGCEHFGISALKNPTRTAYRWLVANPQVPGQLMVSPAPVSLPLPYWSVVQAAQPGLAPVVFAQIDPAPPVVPPPPAQFGEAQWVKVYKTENARPVDLLELVGGNVVVPQDAAHLESNWSLLQADPVVGTQRRRGRQINKGNLGNGNRAVVRRYEHYEYAGKYDPVTHQALCADLTCTAPQAGELGNAIGAQNVAVNIDTNTLAVSIVGSGAVTSSDGAIKCANACFGNYNPGTSVTLTAKPASNKVLARWSGACSGASLTCTVSVFAATAVTATFVDGAPVVGGGGGGGSGGSGGGKKP